MGFPATVREVTVVLGASGGIGWVLRQCWPGMLSAEAQTRWQARRPQADAGLQEDWVILDPLQDPDGLMQALEGADQVLCLAGVVPGRGTDLADNTHLALAAIEAAAQAADRSGRDEGAARVFLASSAAVYGAGSGLLREEEPVRPTHAYGQAKRDMELQALARGQELGVPVCALRIGNIAGLDAILGGWRPGFSLDCFPNGQSPRRSYIGVRTLAQVLAALLRTPRLPPIVNLAQPGTIDMGDLLRAAGREFALQPASERAIPEVAFDLTLLQKALSQKDMPATADAACLAREWAVLEPDFHALHLEGSERP
ncbi:NAD(P)-dependent oxidoreductase (plasmid) [Parasedimentitalea marina]|uniref:NAD(P)-dependent oxidoreductase n=1 Tax=Parasedimentitalea marina TaxID=2483033 RepID=A0A3T0N9D5_9RHOB|nr:NAD(P)-dependent oxidoreductase [Parasedimentitalea marina]AZV80638.1 NAD(P)-dependent oxidoreductase [Parasedimentitalea marina]